MKWVNAIRELPKNNQEVLVSKNEEFFIASYAATEKIFHCKNGVKLLVADDIKWAELLPPPKD
jgi:hypothetical protein